MKNMEERIDDIMTADGISLKSFEIKNDLNRIFWDRRNDNKLIPEIRARLLKIAGDFISTLDFDDILDVPVMGSFVKDVWFLGSLASYNYSSYSDVDMHIIVDMDSLKLTPSQLELLKKYFTEKKNDWNNKHPELLVKGHDVELYVQDINEKNAANGIYSLFYNKWLKLPVRMPVNSFSQKKVKDRAAWYIERIERLEKMLWGKNIDPNKAKSIGELLKTIKDRIIKARRASLNGANRNEMSEDNIVFKVLRRTGHIGRLNDLIDRAYDLSNSLDEGNVKMKTANEGSSTKEMLKNLFPNLPPVPTEEELRAKEETFHVGDRVKVVDNIRCRQKGKVGTISRIDPDDGYGWKLFIVDFDDEQYGSMGFQSGYIDKVVSEDCCCVSALGGDGFGDGKPALTKGDYHIPEVLTKNPLRRKNTMNESTKITLTVGQLRRVLSESWEDYQQEVFRKNEDMRFRIEKIAKMFEERGFVRDKRVIFGTPDNPSVSLFDPKKRNRVYLGTYLNEFSINEKRHGEYLWIDEWADDYASINISPVYRHNGTNADVSVEITVSENKSKVSPDPTRWDNVLSHSIGRREKYIQIVKDESPFNYMEEENPITVSRYGNTTRIAKLSSTAGDRSILNAVNKAIDMANAYTPADWSSYEKDPKDYHKDTQDIYHGKKSVNTFITTI